MATLLHKHILATISYFDAQDHPLTTFEIWRHLFTLSRIQVTSPLSAVSQTLEELQYKHVISCASGFWCFQGRESLSQQRIRRQKISLGKIKRAQQWARWLRGLPYIQAVFLTGTLGMQKASVRSDWDTLVVTKKKRIWLARCVMTTFLYFLRKWRHGAYIKDRFCLNHFITEDGLILEEQNEFTAKEISYCIPLFGEPYYRKFQQFNEFWVQQYQPHYRKDLVMSAFLLPESPRTTKMKQVSENIVEKSRLGAWSNDRVREIMIRKIKSNPLTHVEGADIRYHDQALVFLPAPQREKVLRTMMLRLTKMRQ